MTSLELFRDAKDAVAFDSEVTIFSEGDDGNRMYVVLEGEVRILIGGHVVETAGPGSLFGEMALIDAGPRSASAIAGTHCRVVPVDRTRFTSLVQRNPNFALLVMRVMADRLRRMDHRMS